MEKDVLLSRLRQLKKDVDASKSGLIDGSIVDIANQLLNEAKEYYKEDLRDLELIKTKTYSPSGEKAPQEEVSAKLGQAIAVLEADIEGPSSA